MNELAVLLRTINFAAEKHVNQRRKNATKAPYIGHPIGVATLLAEKGVTDLITLQAAIGHDLVEDTPTTFAELEQLFGATVAGVVREVTDDKSLPKDVRKREQVKHAAQASTRARLVKLADKIHNLRDIQACPPPWPAERIQGYFLWCREVVNAMRGTHADLEAELDLLFSGSFVLDGKTYSTIAAGDPAVLLAEYYESMKHADH